MAEKLINLDTGKVIIHAVSMTQGDMSLCGDDLDGDSGEVNYNNSTTTSEKINCETCIAIINYCKSIPANRLSKKTISFNDWRGRDS